MIAACTVAGLTLLLVIGKADEGAVSIFKLATILERDRQRDLARR